MIIAIAIVGWAVAVALAVDRRRYRQPVVFPAHVAETPSRAVLVNSAGLPESLRTLRGPAPKEYTRPHGKGVATIYQRIGTAVVYQATAPRQAQ